MVRLDRDLLKKLYWEDGLAVFEIQTMTGRSKSSIHRDLIFWNIPRRSYMDSYRIRDAKGKCWHNDVNLRMRSSLAYILGALYGDGYAIRKKKGRERGKCFIGISVSDRYFAEEFASNVRKLGLHCEVKEYNWKMPRAKNWKPSYRAIFWCAKFYYWFKSLTYEKVEKLLQTEPLIVAFIKGFYEAEGCCFKRGNRITLTIANCDKALIELVDRLLVKIGFQFRFHGPYYPKNPKWSPHYNLYLGIREETKHFLSMIKPCVKGG